MNFLKSILVSVALLVAASSANAATGTYTDLGKIAVLDIAEIDLGLNAYTATVKPVGEFNHSFIFTLPELADVSATLNNIVVQFPGFDVFNIAGATYSILNSSNDVLGSAAAGTSFNVSGLAAGQYTFNVVGTTTGIAGGTYGFAINVTPVPEPSSVAMLLVGFAALGAVARRRKTL
ncbi:FxDxF family PEP-CTERM protein [Methylobacillus gramineus]|uniref:FxDxF family PEP-CTERM protein n=1 Tax=Methylobacillus gramineus TaxID=755169 RepID=UPI001CFF6851|nr:FxDxF family PEP-CTERM protein [Methylobacillus gramineus]MCB5186052.1 FxDxF family PEP-CTERM protein [Methylobacillus gramineus]